ncbi:hypothetical protein [Sodalis glossinidius]|uniref:hypothetical protein n=1 Tax=Sodalis glossinidius TaxID=63612 RepID=UPI00031A15A9|nr:hypothetical protein [Sodalis glossinidius]
MALRAPAGRKPRRGFAAWAAAEYPQRQPRAGLQTARLARRYRHGETPVQGQRDDPLVVAFRLTCKVNLSRFNDGQKRCVTRT